ncbi:hypothetical protein [Dyella choica]|uniref:YHYH domain-containing protein n=1 Tax=Dyella choica TaxID=1927959 RepID=A0A432M9A5_9GAMM|nr:hypothetical protein [Dyella choica]RUL78769.1 hypothetical protein EKH80_02855 [Dyella choica]
MDTVCAIARRLTVALLVFVVGMFFASSPVRAAVTAGQAYQSCQAILAQDQATWGSSFQTQPCKQSTNPVSGNPAYCFPYGLAGQGYPWLGGCTDYTGSPVNPCSMLANSSIDTYYFPGEQLGTTGQTLVTDPNSGGKVWCPYTIQWSGASGIADAYGHYHIHATITYTGDLGDTGPSGGPTSPQMNDPNGNPLSQQPTTSNGPSPTICGGGSCYDPNTDQFCGVSGGGQFCIPAHTAESSQGGCVSSGGGTLCAGSPSAPLPNPTQNQITDPSTQIGSSDKYTQSNISTGATSGVTVNTYNSPGGSVSSGSTNSSLPASNSSGSKSSPASSSSTGNGGSYGGGSDCNSPPACSGDAVMCGVGRQEWYAMCNQQKYMVGDDSGPSTFQQDLSKYSQSDVTVQPSNGNTVGDQANNGSYDSGGFGYGTQCPAQDLQVSIGKFGSFTVPFSLICPIGPWIYGLVVGFALYRAACVTAGSAF